MKLKSIRIILVGTTHPGNIGSTARAMKTMGIQKLYLVAPKHFPDLRAYEMAAGADDLLDEAILTDSLSAAITDCQLVIGTSARMRNIDLPNLTPKDAAQLVQQTPSATEIAFVFGREHSGLTNEELLQCHYHMHIPSSPEYASLNLAQAVQIVAYELRMAFLSTSEILTPLTQMATSSELEGFYDHLNKVLITIGFLKPSNPRRLLQKLRRLFNRARLEPSEINILRGILKQILVMIEKTEKNES